MTGGSKSSSGDGTPAPATTTTAAAEPPARPDDCLGCRVTGLMLGLGGAGYLSSSLWVDPPPRGAHRAAILAASAALLALGVGRAVGW
jgi:hypothetical protein